MKKTQIAITLFLIINFTNTQFDNFFNIKNLITRFRIDQFIKNTNIYKLIDGLRKNRIYQLYQDLKKRFGGLLSKKGPIRKEDEEELREKLELFEELLEEEKENEEDLAFLR